MSLVANEIRTISQTQIQKKIRVITEIKKKKRIQGKKKHKNSVVSPVNSHFFFNVM
jgi:hypothetical protein